jgi:hypothetical protein
MSNWINPTINIGTILEDEVIESTFKQKLNALEIRVISPYCGCTKVKHYPTLKEIKVTFKAGKVPNQIPAGELQELNHGIEVFYADGTSEVLKLTGFKKRRYEV